MPRKQPTVLLVNPPSAPGTTANREGSGGLGTVVRARRGFIYPPLTIAQLLAQLNAAGYEADGIDVVWERLSPEYAFSLITQTRRPEVVGIYSTVMTAEEDLQFAASVRRALPDTPLFLFGASVHLYLEDIWKKAEADYVLIGEPECGITGLCDSILRGTPMPKSALKRGQNLEPGNSPQRFDSLDALPIPAWNRLISRRHPQILTILSSRGCPDTCSYCPYRVGFGSVIRAQSPARTVDELTALHSHKLCRHVIFKDPVFAADRVRTVNVCEELLHRGIRSSWECESRPEHFNAELLGLMARAGCKTIKFGVESVSERLLRRYNRLGDDSQNAQYLDSIRAAVAAAHAAGIASYPFIMIGLPGETMNDIEQTARFIEELKPSKVGVKLFENYPGTGTFTKPDTTLSPVYTQLLCLQEELKARFEPHKTGQQQRPILHRIRELIGRLLEGKKRS